MTTPEHISCPIPLSDYPTVQLAHGGGGTLMHQLIDRIFRAAFRNEYLDAQLDSTVLELQGKRVAFSTDSYVVRPLTFPGGDIGTLAVNGTVNDLAMSGARPRYLSAGFILEEGLEMATLWHIVQSMQRCAVDAEVQIVTGDTKVVDRGKGDGIFINTTGIGTIEHALKIAPSSTMPGDALLLNGDLGRHGTAIIAQREGLQFETSIESDCAPLNGLVQALLDEGVALRCMRDLTRGGLSSALVEIAETGKRHLHIETRNVPVHDEVRGACEILGLDPMYVANEGRMLAIVPGEEAERALACMRTTQVGKGACRIGTVTNDTPGQVTVSSEIGATRILDMLSGEQLPRIC